MVLAQEAYIPSNAAVMSLMVELDANHDGHVTLDEFSRAMKKLDFIGFHMIRHAYVVPPHCIIIGMVNHSVVVW